ncbi:phage head spike fiber domain-containing protein [Solidesulfovibrio sp.]
MALNQLTSPPPPPGPTDGTNFGTRAFAFLNWWYTVHGPELNEWVAAFNAITPAELGAASIEALAAEVAAREAHEAEANPHSGSASTAALADLAGDLAAHAGQANPHGTTAADVGAAPADQGVAGGNNHNHDGGDGGQVAHSALSGIGTNSHEQIDTHLIDTNNPHGVTAAQAGAIPADSGAATAYVSPATTSAAGKAQLTTLPDAVAGTDSAKIITAAAAKQAFVSWLRDTTGKFHGVIPPTLNLFAGDATSDAVPIGTFARSTTGTRRGPTGLIETVAAGAIRREWDANGNLLGWLIEESRTNSVLHCRDLTQAAWVKTGCTPLLNQNGVDGVANSASQLTASTADATCLQAIALSSSLRFQTAYVRRLNGTGAVYMTTDGGTTWTAIALTASWSRLLIPSQTVTNPVVGFKIAVSGDAIAVDYVQNEGGAFPTSAMLTTTTAFVRSADVWTIATNAFSFNASEGTVFADVDIPFSNPSNAFLFHLDDGGATNRISVLNTASTPTLQPFTTSAGTTVFFPAGYAMVREARQKIALAYAASNFGVAYNGGTLQTQLSGAVPVAVTMLRVGQNQSGFQLNGHVRQLSYFPRSFSGAALQSVTL